MIVVIPLTLSLSLELLLEALESSLQCALCLLLCLLRENVINFIFDLTALGVKLTRVSLEGD